MPEKKIEPQPQEIEAAKAQHPDRELMLLKGQTATVIAVIPQRMEVDRWRQGVIDVKNRPRATAEFVQNAIVWPPMPQLLALINARPFLIEEWFNKIFAEAGGAEEAEVKKL